MIFTPFYRSAPTQRPPQAGFALIITIILMSMMVLLMVSMASLTRVETQIAANYQKADQARENALYALKIALGQLQKHVGPDQRTTARADILGAATRSDTDTWNGSAVTPLNSTVFHNNSLLTGVWGNSAVSTAAAANSAYVNTPQLLTWLVSGNETASYATKTTAVDFGRVNTAVTVVPGTYTPASAFTPSTANPAVQLIGPMTVGGTRNADGTITATAAQKAAMVAAITQPITVASRLIPGQSATDTPIAVGRYAYWVGDEGVKAKFNLPDQWADTTATTDAQQRYRYQVAQRAGIELMTKVDPTTKLPDGPISSGSYDQASAYGRLNIAKTIAYGSIPLGSAVTQATAQARFHDLTTYSHGVLSNTRDGGLKKDLTAAFAPGTTSTTAPTGKLWTIPPAALGSAYGANMLTSSNAYDGLGPDWQVLRSYAQLGTAVIGTGTAASIDPIAPAAPASNPTEQIQMGVSPVVVGYRLFVSTKLVQVVGGQYQLELRLIPTVMLWNPYNVTLKNANYGFEMDFKMANGPAILARIIQTPATAPETNDTARAINASAQVESPYFYKFKGLTTNSGARAYPLKFEAASGDMEPGRAYIYTLPGDVAVTDAIAANYTAGAVVLTRGWAPGGTLGYGLLSQSPTFAAPAAPAGGGAYWIRLFQSGLGNPDAKMPNWIEATTGGSWSSTRLVMRLGSLSGPPLQTIESGEVPTQNTSSNTVYYKFIANSPIAPVHGPCWGYKAALKATDFTSNGIAINTTTNALVPWVAAYNPRATNSGRSAWEDQKVGWRGYYNENPSFGFRRQDGASGPVTSRSEYTENESNGYYPFGVAPTDATNTPVVLFDIPRAGQPLQSLGALQHANLYRGSLNTATPFVASMYKFSNNVAPAYVVGNSKVDQRGDLALPYSFLSRPAGIGFASLPVYYDHSFLANRALWDGYFFSTVPTSGALTFPLPNGRHVLAGAAKTNDTTSLRDADLAPSRLLVDGAFNINSTSEEAWRAVLASTLNAPVGSQAFPDQAPVPRLLYPISDSAVLTSTSWAETKTNSYAGYRALSSAQITALATQIVTQVKARGPFVSLADFVNRALLDTSSNAGTANDIRLGGALHTAIAAAGINSAFSSTAAVLPVPGATFNTYPVTHTAATGDGASAAAASPGWVTQADLLQVLGPVLSARSDTFVVRTYGEVLDPLLSAGDPKHVQARAWAEAIVQRMPEYIDPTDSQLTNGDATAPALANPTNQNFGRRLKIIYFRWLSPSDI